MDKAIISSMSLSDGCHYCGGEASTWDHIVPQKLGGGGSVDNLVPCCQRCNSSKGSKPLFVWRKHLKARGLPADFDVPEPYAISGKRTRAGGFVSDDGSIVLTWDEYISRVDVNLPYKQLAEWGQSKTLRR